MTEPTIAELLDRLLDQPLEGARALEHRLRDVDTAELRTRLIERLLQGGLRGRSLENGLDVLAAIGLDEFSRRRLFEVATGADTGVQTRQLAAMALMMDPQLDPMELAGRFGPGKLDELMAANVSILMQHAERDPDVAVEIADQLMEIPPEERAMMFEAIDDTRRQLGLEAGLVYGGLFDHHNYEPLWPLVAEAVLEDDTPGDAPLLEQAAGRAEDRSVERRLRQHAMRLRTRGIADHQGERTSQGRQAGFGLFGSCDGTGGYPLLVARRRDDDRLDVVNLLFRTTGQYRDAFIFELEDRRALDEMVDRMRDQAGAEFVELPLATAAALVEKRLDRVRDRRDELPAEFSQVDRYVRRLDADHDAIPPVQAGGAVEDIERLRSLFSRSGYRHWYLDRATLVEAGLGDIDHRPDSRETIDDYIDRLGSIPSVVEQTASMAGHMALWHAFEGDDDTASLMARLVRQTRDEPTNSFLLRMRLDKTFDEWSRIAGDNEFPIDWIEDPDLRRHLRQLFFSGVDTPTGRDVLHLALTCVAFIALDWSLEYVPAARHPRPDDRYRLAYRAATSIVDHLVQRERPEPRQLHGAVADALADSSLQQEDARQLAAWILADAQQYIDDYAPPQFYQAIAEPNRQMAGAFFD